MLANVTQWKVKTSSIYSKYKEEWYLERTKQETNDDLILWTIYESMFPTGGKRISTAFLKENRNIMGGHYRVLLQQCDLSKI